ncbi:InlB B-repeat-containing protein [Merdimonas faecis]
MNPVYAPGEKTLCLAYAIIKNALRCGNKGNRSRSEGGMRMKKRWMTLFLCLCLVFTMLPATALAGEEQADGTGAEPAAGCICTELCSEYNVNKDCPICGVEGADLSGCKGVASAECTCETIYTAEEINADCPVCAAEGAELDKVCVGVAPMLPVTALAAGEHDSHSDGWTELTVDTTTISGGSYYLSDDVVYTGAESITVSGEVILCLNGQELNLNGQHISVSNGASLTLCDCSTGGVLTGGSGSNGGGVYVDGGGTFTMTGGSIVGNTANAGGGVYVYKGGTFTMEGGSINNNTTTSGGGGGVMVYEGTFTLSGGSITGNATNSETYGFGGGVCLYGTFYLSGDVIIQGNTKAGTADNLYLGWQTINITGPLGKNAHIGVNAEAVPSSFISGWSDNMAGKDPADYFSSDGDACGIGLNTAGDVVLGSQSTTITLQPNGGTLPEHSLVEGAALPIPSRIGYTFAGWYGNPEFSGDPVTDVPTGSTVNLTFYAAWTPNTYTVTFDANGGSVSQTSAVTVAGKLTSLPTPTYDGHNFLGWYTQKDGGDKVTTDTVFTVDSTIYAHWQNIPVIGVKLDKTSLTMQEKGSATLTATVEPADATNKNVTWESSDISIATVDASGKVTAISAGSATITATAADGSGVSASCSVTVTHGNMVHTSKKVATCTAEGNTEYWTCETCGKHFSDEEGKTEIELSATVIPATGHSYKEPVWNWSEDGKSCTVTFTCVNVDSHKETPKVTVSSKIKTPATCTEKGVTEYTATAEFHGKTFTDTKAVADIDLTAHNYKDGKCTVCGAADPAYQKPAKSDTVSGKNDTAKAVQTGDMANPAVWILLLTASVLVFAGAVVFRKKKGN